MTHSGNSRCRCERSAGPRTADKRVLCAAIYQPSSISPPCARPKGLKLEQWISVLNVRCLLVVSTDPRGSARGAFVTPLSLARQKFHAASRSFSLSFFFPFLFFFFFSYTPDLASVIGPRHAPMPLLFVSVRFEFALPSSRLATLPYLSRRRAHTRLLIPFPVFPLARLYELPYDLPFRFISTSRRAGEPVFRGETLLQRILFVPLA